MFSQHQLENLQAGISPSSETGDFSDVKVVSPYGEIPWDKVSRFDDDEMKELMIDVVNHCYDSLLMLFGDETGDDIVELLRTTDLQKDPTGIVQ